MNEFQKAEEWGTKNLIESTSSKNYLFKISGSLVNDKTVIKELKNKSRNNTLTIVHGCGEQISEKFKELDISYTFDNLGRRIINNQSDMRLIENIVEEVNKELADKLGLKAIKTGVKAKKISNYTGIPTNLLYDYETYRNSVIGSLGIEKGNILNLNADEVGECLIKNINYSKIIYITRKQNNYGKGLKEKIIKDTNIEIIYR